MFNTFVFAILRTILNELILICGKTQETQTKLVNNEPLVENLNRLEPDAIEASGIDEAIKALR